MMKEIVADATNNCRLRTNRRSTNVRPHTTKINNKWRKPRKIRVIRLCVGERLAIAFGQTSCIGAMVDSMPVGYHRVHAANSLPDAWR